MVTCVSRLVELKAAESLNDLALILGYAPKTLAFLVYKLDDERKYRKFVIPKRTGGEREICAPFPPMALLQRRLAELLSDCYEELDSQPGYPKFVAEGFRKNRSIITNAQKHKNSRYVLNLDIENFFPSFNFGRVRGFFIRNRSFLLNERVATVIAQIACFENSLPQGSPCSPVISNLICHSLDVHLLGLAKRCKCQYSRYADDITFSSSQRKFPKALAYQSDGEAIWALGVSLRNEITRAGFSVNERKTRVQYRPSRQVVTGLVVNKKVNVPRDYMRRVRSMCHSYFHKGYYHYQSQVHDDGEIGPEEIVTNPNPLEGMLSFIHNVRNSTKSVIELRSLLTKTSGAPDEPIAFLTLYRKFFILKTFVLLDKPLIMCEGKTDNVYLDAAIERLPEFQPSLAEKVGDFLVRKVRFFRYGKTSGSLLLLAGGTGDLKEIVLQYGNWMKAYSNVDQRARHPVILLIDNDDGATAIFKILKARLGAQAPTLTSANQFYWIDKNLYLVKTPEGVGDGKSCIEDLFEDKWHEVLIEGRRFNSSKEHEALGEYGKEIFAQRVVRKNSGEIDFSAFSVLLNRIVSVIEDYSLRRGGA